MSDRTLIWLLGALVLISALGTIFEPKTRITTACWTDAQGQPICRGAVRRAN